MISRLQKFFNRHFDEKKRWYERSEYAIITRAPYRHEFRVMSLDQKAPSIWIVIVIRKCYILRVGVGVATMVSER